MYHLPKSIPFNKKRPRKPKTGIKHGFQAGNTNSRLEHSVRKNRTTFSEICCSWKCSTGTSRKNPNSFYCRLYFPDRFSGNLGKQPTCFGQTAGRFTVWINGLKSSGLVNFVPESLLPFVPISSIYLRMALKKWNTNFRL